MHTISLTVFVLSLLLCLVLGLVVGFTAGFRQGESAAVNSGTGEASQVVLSSQAAMSSQLSAQLRPVFESLSALSGKVQQFELHQRENLAGLRTQLQVAQRVDQQILEATLGLDSALRNTSHRGSWGEASLRRVLELAGLTKQVDFVEQAHLEDEFGKLVGIPDVVVHLPNQAALIIDAKVPLDAYLQVEDLADVEQLRAHSVAVRRHVAALAKRDYAQHLQVAVDSVILFMPSEALVSASLQGDPTLFETALQQGVIVVGPSGLMALLRSVSYLWARQSLTEDAADILQLGSTLTQRLNRLSQLLGTLGKHLHSAVSAYNDVIGSFEARLQATVRSITTLEGKVADELKPAEVTIRQPPVCD